MGRRSQGDGSSPSVPASWRRQLRDLDRRVDDATRILNLIVFDITKRGKWLQKYASLDMRRMNLRRKMKGIKRERYQRGSD